MLRGVRGCSGNSGTSGARCIWPAQEERMGKQALFFERYDPVSKQSGVFRLSRSLGDRIPVAFFIIREPITDYVSTTTDPAQGNREEGPPKVRIRHGPGATSGRCPSPSAQSSTPPSRTQNPEKAPAPAKTYPAFTSPWRRSARSYEPPGPYQAFETNDKDRYTEKDLILALRSS